MRFRIKRGMNICLHFNFSADLETVFFFVRFDLVAGKYLRKYLFGGSQGDILKLAPNRNKYYVIYRYCKVFVSLPSFI